ncbi:hypothetical protein FBU30_008570 [Linnemannia zychae]|nr:hypothetical protein FBU30_008570 [Linnemannia zychae]
MLSIPNSNSQKRRALQKNGTIPTTASQATTASTVTTTKSIVQLQSVIAKEEEDLNDFETSAFTTATTSSTIYYFKTPSKADGLVIQSVAGSATVDNTNDKESIGGATLLTDTMHHLDDDDNLNENDDFAFDEIQDWDDVEDISPLTTPIDPVPDNACPVCGLNLSSLDTMTPAAHVNRCLDGSLIDQEQQTPITIAAANMTLPTMPSNPPKPANSLSNAIGTIRSVISNFPSYLSTSNQPSKTSEIATSATNQIGDKKAGSRYFKTKTPRPCPFYKKMPDTGFTVDAFNYGKIEGCDAYFLTHFHSDHYGGLTSTWSHGPIYCSSITANLVISRLKVDEQYINRLPMYKPTVVNGVTVRLMDANHCPGSVLFVFDVHNPKRRYLHTGDFRASPGMTIDPILKQPENVPIDVLYLDTTYSNPRYTFPPQDVVINETARLICKEIGIESKPSVTTATHVKAKPVNLMENWLKKESGNGEKLLSMSNKALQTAKNKRAWKEPAEKNKIVVCVGTYLIGKERVWKAIAKAINSKVYVQPSKLEILRCLEDSELMNMLTTDKREAQVHLMHMGSEMSPEGLQDYLESLAPTFVRLIAVRPTGWTFTGTKKFTSADDNGPTDKVILAKSPTSLDLRPSYTSSTIKIYPVPYSEHSSFSELAGFVRSLNIHKVIPTVGVGSDKGRHAMHEWFKRWEQERRQGIRWSD